MVDSGWPLEELARRATWALRRVAIAPVSARVRDLPDPRTIRYYTTLGLLDRPQAYRGRVAVYGPRHLLQLVAIKRLQAEGHPLHEVQRQLHGLSDAELATLAALPEGALEAAQPSPAPAPAPAPAPTSPRRPPSRPFWKATVAASPSDERPAAASPIDESSAAASLPDERPAAASLPDERPAAFVAPVAPASRPAAFVAPTAPASRPAAAFVAPAAPASRPAAAFVAPATPASRPAAAIVAPATPAGQPAAPVEPASRPAAPTALRLAPSALLILEPSSRPLTADDERALREAAAPLVRWLAARTLSSEPVDES